MIRPVVIFAPLVPLLLLAGCADYREMLPGAHAPDPGLELCREATFKQMDGNSDGVLDPAEAAAPPMSLSSAFFDRIDGNNDGVIDWQEYEQMGVFVRCELCPGIADCPLGRSGKAGEDSTMP